MSLFGITAKKTLDKVTRPQLSALLSAACEDERSELVRSILNTHRLSTTEVELVLMNSIRYNRVNIVRELLNFTDMRNDEFIISYAKNDKKNDDMLRVILEKHPHITLELVHALNENGYETVVNEFVKDKELPSKYETATESTLCNELELMPNNRRFVMDEIERRIRAENAANAVNSAETSAQ